MKDGIIKGTGNSRNLKSVADFLTRYPNYESFAQALITGTLPIDLNGINPEGWTQVGTPLNKGSLLSDTTAAGMGLTEDATVNNGLNAALPKNGGAMSGTLSDPNAAQVRNITVSDQNLEAGVSELADGEVYFVYE